MCLALSYPHLYRTKQRYNGTMVGMTIEALYDELSSNYIRLTELYANQQLVIEKLVANGARVCEGSTTVTYELPILDLDEGEGDRMIRPHINKLRALRKMHGLTLAELATRLDTTSAVVGRWELGIRDPNLTKVEQWAFALGAQATIIIQSLEAIE